MPMGRLNVEDPPPREVVGKNSPARASTTLAIANTVAEVGPGQRPAAAGLTISPVIAMPRHPLLHRSA